MGRALVALLMATSTRLAQGLVGEGAVSVARARRVAPLCAVAPPVQVAAADDPLVKLANEFIYEKSGFYSAADESAFSEEFIFRGPLVGPLTKADYLATLGTFKIYESVPDISPNAWGFSRDPLDPNRVWFMVRNSGTFSGTGLDVGSGIVVPPNGAELNGCPETFSVTFDESGKLKYFSVGYVADRFEGNTNGKGAAVGIFAIAGFPVPPPGPLLSLSNWITNELIAGPVRTYSENVPSWWSSPLRAAEGY